MRKKIVVGNWKMNLQWNEAKSLVKKLNEASSEIPASVSVVIAPPTPYLAAMASLVDDSFRVAAQNCSQHQSGAFTGEHSASMLSSIYVNKCIVGHSERRSLFHEDNKLIGQKVKACLQAGITPILCCGEQLEERNNNNQFETVRSQLASGLAEVDQKSLGNVIIAYEPVWAIGTGKTATSQQAREMHSFIRKLLISMSDKLTADIIPVLYGGSVKPENAPELFGCENVDGGLVGGASLNARDFIEIVKAAS